MFSFKLGEIDLLTKFKNILLQKKKTCFFFIIGEKVIYITKI